MTELERARAEVAKASHRMLRLTIDKSTTAEVVSIYADHQGPMWIDCYELASDIALSLSRHRDFLLITWLGDSEVGLSAEAARALGSHVGHLWLLGFSGIDAREVVSELARHNGALHLTPIGNLTPDVLEALARHKGKLTLRGFQGLTAKTVEALAQHEGGVLLLVDQADHIPREVVEALHCHKDKVSLRQLSDITIKPAKPINDSEWATTREDSTLAEIMDELNSLTGLESVKQEVRDLHTLLQVQALRVQRGMSPLAISQHLVFYGNPGTGKTTVARLLSRIYASLGFLSKGHMVETDRSGLVAGFIGQTALKTRKVCQKALGGVLFIDEAYTLCENQQWDYYGKEAIDTLLKFMEDNRKDLVVIVAGYPARMQDFLASNPGMKSRFTRFMNFQDYSPEELSSIFAGFCKEGGFTLSDGASAKAKGIFEEQFLQRDETFGNARFARNLFEQCLVRHARRITRADNITDGMLTTLEEDDVEWVT